jgi:hypothetical protein
MEQLISFVSHRMDTRCCKWEAAGEQKDSENDKQALFGDDIQHNIGRWGENAIN